MEEGKQEKHRTKILELAREAFSKDEVPVGAIIVNADGEVIGEGYNQTHFSKDGLKHAELVAIQQAQNEMRDWRLENTSMWVTLEPCLMCLGAIGNARIKNLYYILPDPLFGSVESKLGKDKVAEMYPKLNIVKLSEEEDVRNLMNDFFKKMRQK